MAISADDLAWLGVIGGAIVLAAAFLLLTSALAKLYPAPNYNVFAVWKPLIQPEPREEVRSMMTLAAPIVLAGVVLAFGTREPARRWLDPLIVGTQVIAIGLIVLAVLRQPRQSGFLIDYFKPYLLSVPNLVAGVLIGLVLTAAVLRWSGSVPPAIVRAAERIRGRGALAFALAVLATVIFVLPAVVTDATVGQAGQIAAGHIPVQSEDYFSVVNGRTPLVDYIAQYANLLPLVLEPVLKTFHSSITSVSIALCVLSAAGLLAVFGVFREVTRGPWLALGLYLPFLALALFPWNDSGPFRNFDANYYGILPGRLFGPLLLAWLFALSTRRRIPIWALFGFAGLVVLNNVEFGTPALLGLIVAVAASWDRAEPLRDRLSRIAVQGAAGLLGALAIVCAVILLRTGELPDPTLLTYFNRVFLRDSFGLVAMPSLGLQWALYATYAGALLMAAVRYVRDEPDRTLTAMLAFSGVFGLATGMYFVGRSSQFQLMLLFPAWAFALALVAWTAARSLRAARGDRAILTRLLLPACAALIGFGVMVSAIGRVSPPWRQVDRLTTGGPGAHDLLGPQHYVEANTTPGEHVLIIGTTLDHRVADRAGVVNVSPLNGITALISPPEADRALDQLEDEGGNEVFESVSNAPATGGLTFKVPELAPILRQHGYRLVGDDPASGLRLWRRSAG
ncbi:MAG TPA: hypothetical protein VHU24_00540 [Solirubrobacterales bacterium]|nr:hypothetical protein [Solirubrobacterales bacterium]